MATGEVRVVEINEGRKIPFEQDGTKLLFGDDEIMVNCARYQRNCPVHLDICFDRVGNLVIGVGEGRYYVAQIDIPEIQYVEEPDEDDQVNLTPLPLDMQDVTLTLWSIENFN